MARKSIAFWSRSLLPGVAARARVRVCRFTGSASLGECARRWWHSMRTAVCLLVSLFFFFSPLVSCPGCDCVEDRPRRSGRPEGPKREEKERGRRWAEATKAPKKNRKKRRQTIRADPPCVCRLYGCVSVLPLLFPWCLGKLRRLWPATAQPPAGPTNARVPPHHVSKKGKMTVLSC